MGADAGLRLSGGWRRRARRGAREGQGQDALRPGAPRGDGGLHGLRPCQIHRRRRALLCDLGARGDPSPQRALRRQDGPRAGGRAGRPTGPHRHWGELPAGGRPAEPLQGRRRRLRAYGQRPRSGAPPDRPGRAYRRDEARRHLRHLAERPAGADLRGPARQAWHDPYRDRLRRPGAAARRDRSAQGGRDPRRRREGRHPGRRRGAWRDRRGDRRCRAAAGRRRQGAARQGGAAGRPALGDGLPRPARHQAELGT